jgi:hypothetical protein
MLPGTAAAQSANDRFGIRMIYPTRPGGEVWFMDMESPGSDPRFDPQGELERDPADGSWHFEDPDENRKVRMGVATSSGYDASRIVDDHGKLALRGYMQDPNDWKNIEMTGYVRVESVSDDGDEITWYARGGKHGDRPCEGVGYKGDLKFDGSVRFAKEQWHVDYHFRPKDPKPFTSSIVGRWIGFKTIMANVDDDRHVQLELWVDVDADNRWTRALPAAGEPPFVDAGGWGDAAQVCSDTPVPPDLVVTWGGPLAVFRWDNVERISFKNLSVREISLQPQLRLFADGFE